MTTATLGQIGQDAGPRNTQIAFIYEPDDRVLCWYDTKWEPFSRLNAALGSRIEALKKQLAQGECPSWEGCVTAYAEEARRQAGCVGYSLTSEDE